jgi:hypothetical protein
MKSNRNDNLGMGPHRPVRLVQQGHETGQMKWIEFLHALGEGFVGVLGPTPIMANWA